MPSILTFNTLARIEDAKPNYTIDRTDTITCKIQQTCVDDGEYDNESAHETDKINQNSPDPYSSDDDRRAGDSDLDILDLLKSYKYKGKDLFLSLNIDYSMKMVNLDWWRMGFTTYGLENDHNYAQISNRFIHKSNPSPSEICPICLDNLTKNVISLNGCSHNFHMECINEYKNTKKHTIKTLTCPLCSTLSLPGTGPSPRGTMSWRLSNKDIMLDGNIITGVLKIKYTIQPGTQMRCHPHPGSPHNGGQFKAYLPLNDEYVSLLKLLILAFLDGQTFTIKTRPFEQSNVDAVDWNIEHKYNLHGGISNFGYPDTNYLERVSNHIVGLLNNAK